MVEQLYSSMLPRLQELERQRQAVWQTVRQRCLYATLGVAFALFWGLLPNLLGIRLDGAILSLPLLAGIGVFIYFVGYAYRGYESFRIKLKRQLIGALLSDLGESLQYDADQHIDKATFNASRLFTSRPHRFQGEDLIHGQHGNTDFAISELQAKERRRSNDGKRTRYVTFFEGLFLTADFNKHFQGRTYVLPDYTENWIGSWMSKALQSFGSRGGELIYLEDVDFEKQFQVYSTDPVEARYILTPRMVQAILALRRKFNARIRLGFSEARVFLAVPMQQDMLEPSVWTEITKQQAVEQIYNELRLMLDIIDDLDLNTRIWSKG